MVVHAFGLTGGFDDQGNVQGALVNILGVLNQVVFPEELPVVAGDHEAHVVVETVLAQGLEEVTQALVQIGDRRVVLVLQSVE